MSFLHFVSHIIVKRTNIFTTCAFMWQRSCRLHLLPFLHSAGAYFCCDLVVRRTPPTHPVCSPAAESIPGSIQACYYDMTLMILNTCLTTSNTHPHRHVFLPPLPPSLQLILKDLHRPSFRGEMRHRPADRLMNHPSVRGCNAVMRQAKQEVTLQSW